MWLDKIRVTYGIIYIYIYIGKEQMLCQSLQDLKPLISTNRYKCVQISDKKILLKKFN